MGFQNAVGYAPKGFPGQRWDTNRSNDRIAIAASEIAPGSFTWYVADQTNPNSNYVGRSVTQAPTASEMAQGAGFALITVNPSYQFNPQNQAVLSIEPGSAVDIATSDSVVIKFKTALANADIKIGAKGQLVVKAADIPGGLVTIEDSTSHAAGDVSLDTFQVIAILEPFDAASGYGLAVVAGSATAAITVVA